MTPRRFLAKVFRRIAYEIDHSLFEAPAANTLAVDDYSPFNTALRDASESGWYNLKTSELYPGFAIGPGDTVADIGCGGGDNARFCARMGAHLLLADVSQYALDVARAAAGEFDPAVEAYLSDSDTVPIADQRCTRVVCTEVLEHVEDPAHMMRELVRIGAAGARYMLSVPGELGERVVKEFAAPSVFERPNHIRIFESSEFARLVTDAGLVIEARSSYGAYRSIWWWLFWCAPMPGLDARHPVLDNWGRTWQALMDAPDGLRIREALDRAIPKSQVIIARKP